MRSSFFSAAFLAFASIVSAQTDGFDVITVPTQDQTIAAGKTLDITWTPSAGYTGQVTITLLQGATTGSLSLGDVITTIASTAGTYSWVVPTTLQYYATYGFKLTNNSDTTGKIFQYSFPFHVTGLDTTSASASGATVTPTTLTLHLSTGTAYASSTSSFSSVITPSASSNTSTVASVTAASFNTTTSKAVLTSTAAATNNVTLSTTITTSASKTSSSASKTATTTAAPTQSTSAAIANIARGSIAVLGGLVLAFAL